LHVPVASQQISQSINIRLVCGCQTTTIKWQTMSPIMRSLPQLVTMALPVRQ